MDQLAVNPRDVVVTSQVGIYSLAGPDGMLDQEASRPVFLDATLRTWDAISETGAQVVTVVDGPRFKSSRVECVAANEDEVTACAEPAAEVLHTHEDPVIAAFRQHPDVHHIDLTPWLCPEGTCPAVIGRTLVYSDNNHLTQTYARSLAQALERQLTPGVQSATRVG